jgi:hypothetical protein
VCMCVSVPYYSLLLSVSQNYPTRLADVIRFWQEHRSQIEKQNRSLAQANKDTRMRTIRQSALALANELFATSLPAFAKDMNNLLAEACGQLKAVLDKEVDEILADMYAWLQVSVRRWVLYI